MRSMAKGLNLALAASLASAAPFSAAQSPPGSFDAGLGYVYPEIELALERDSNIALQPDAARVSDTISYVRPAFRLDAGGGTQAYEAGYRGEYARYRSVKTDDHKNHEVYAGGEWLLDERNKLKLRAQYLRKVDPRGSLQIVTPTPSEYRQSIFGGLYTYGAEEAAGKLELQGGRYSKTYLNNRRDSLDQPLTDVLDHSRTELGATLLVRALPKTYATLTARRYRYTYADAGSFKDSKETYLLVGLRWDITALTSGRVGFGRETKKFDAPGAGTSDFSGGVWEGGLSWKPLFYSHLDFATRRHTAEATGAGDFVVNQSHQLEWTHIWGSRITTVVTAAYAKDSYSGTNRDDATSSAGARLLYAFRRELTFGADYVNSMRSSNDDNFDFKRQQFMLLAKFAL